jgi:hypothetical protein
MKKFKFKLTMPLLIGAMLLAWPLSFGPVFYQRYVAMEALKAPEVRTACLLTSDVVGYDYDGITNRPYILLDGKRYYNGDFRKWDTVVGRILLVTDGRGKQRWTKLTREEAAKISHHYGIASKGCRQLLPETMEARARTKQEYPLLSAIPYNQLQPKTPANFSWEKAVGRAVKPPQKKQDATRKHLP